MQNRAQDTIRVGKRPGGELTKIETKYGVNRRHERGRKAEKRRKRKGDERQKKRTKRKGSKSREENIRSQRQEQQPFWSCVLRCRR